MHQQSRLVDFTRKDSVSEAVYYQNGESVTAALQFYYDPIEKKMQINTEIKLASI